MNRLAVASRSAAFVSGHCRAAARSLRWGSATGKLDEKTQRLCAVMGYASSGNLAKLATAWKQLPVNEHAIAMEAILQSAVYNGFARVLMVLTTIAEVGVKDRIVLEAPYPSSTAQWATWDKRGEEVAKQMYGYKYKRFLAHVRLLHPAYGHWVQNFMLGRVRGREGLDQKTKQLLELVGICGQIVFPQFRATIGNCLTLGSTVEEIRAVVQMTGEFYNQERQAMIDALWRDVNLKRLGTGWTLKDGDKEAEKKALLHGESISEAHLCSDWSHLHSAKELTSPPWRHPSVLTFSNVESLPDRVRIYALAAAHTASGNLSTLRRDWWYLSPDKHQQGLEAVLQTVGLSGFFRLHNALRSLHEQGVCRDAINIKKEDNIMPYIPMFALKGENVLKNIYGPTMEFSTLKKSISAMHPDFWNWIVEFAFGQVAAREVLPLRERELSVLPVLIGMNTFPALQAHMYGALNCGATLDQIRGIFDQTETVWGLAPQTTVDGYWSEFIDNFDRVQKPSD